MWPSMATNSARASSERPLRPGTLATTEVTSAGPHFLRGELIEVLASPRHRTRIPVAAG